MKITLNVTLRYSRQQLMWFGKRSGFWGKYSYFLVKVCAVLSAV